MKLSLRALALTVLLSLLVSCGPPPPPPVTPTVPVTPSATTAPSITPTPVSFLQGIAYSPYRDCQSSDSVEQPTLEQIRQDLQILSRIANGVRTYSSTGINAQIPALARQFGLKVSAGVWLNDDREANEAEISALIEIANTVELDSVIVGNEVLLRNDLSESELLAYIRRVQSAVNVPVTTAEIGGILLEHPQVMAAVDFEMVHLYPFWEGKSIEGAARLAADSYHVIQNQAGGKRVVIGETGWPSYGPVNGAAVPSPENQARYAREFLSLAQAEQIEFYYFDAFDEMWKTEGGVGPYWGLLYADRTFKYDIQSVMQSYGFMSPPTTGEVQAPATPQPTPLSTPEVSNTSAEEFFIYSNFGSPTNHFAPGGWMGDLDSIQYQCLTTDQTWPQTAIQISYDPSQTDTNGWAGIYWLEPDHNWGTVPNAGFDLSDFRQLIFRARAETPGTQIKFIVGGVATSPEGAPLPYPSSIQTAVFAQEADPVDGFVNLSDTWQEYHIDLTDLDLSYVIDGFGWAAERARASDGAVFYLDDIRFTRTEPARPPLPPLHIYSGALLRPGLDMGVAASGGLHDWVEDQNGTMKLSYAAWQDWAVTYISVGSAQTTYGHRSSIDLSAYRTLSVEMKGEQGGEVIFVGMKDSRQLDNGGEPKLEVELTDTWQTYTFDLSKFYPNREFLEHIYIPIEFVFEPTITQDEVIYFRNVQVLP